jgi:hypothetical protein
MMCLWEPSRLLASEITDKQAVMLIKAWFDNVMHAQGAKKTLAFIQLVQGRIRA